VTLRKAILIPLAVIAVGLGMASPALANPAIPSDGFWYQGSTKLTTVKQPIICAATTPFVFTGTYTFPSMPPTNLPAELKASGLACPGGKIFNESHKAKGVGTLEFTGVTAIEPACGPHKAIVTKPLRMQVWTEEGNPTKAFVLFQPVTGSLLAEIVIGEGGGCALITSLPLEGVIFAEMTNPVGTSAIVQELRFSGPINSGAGGSLTFDGHSGATLTGQAGFRLESGLPLAVKPS
jgi:hypothetical protein